MTFNYTNSNNYNKEHTISWKRFKCASAISKYENIPCKWQNQPDLIRKLSSNHINQYSKLSRKGKESSSASLNKLMEQEWRPLEAIRPAISSCSPIRKKTYSNWRDSKTEFRISWIWRIQILIQNILQIEYSHSWIKNKNLK